MDPRISYTALQDEFKDDPELTSDLKASRSKLQTYFKDNYLSRFQQPLVPTTSSSSISSDSSVGTSGPCTVSRLPQKNFTAHSNRQKHTPSDKLLEFWSLPQEDFNTCDPLVTIWTNHFPSHLPFIIYLPPLCHSLPLFILSPLYYIIASLSLPYLLCTLFITRTCILG